MGETIAVADTPPQASIKVMSSRGKAPFTVHAHGLISAVVDPIQARYEWDFGDPGTAYNHLVGWNAAHTYHNPGTYTLRLRLTDGQGRVSTATREIRVDPDNRRRVYVSPSGSDSNNGSSPAAAVRTAERARQLTEDNTTVLFQRGAVHDLYAPFHIEASNVVVTAYGDGSRPVLYWQGNIQYAGIVTMYWWARHIVIDGLEFDSPGQPTTTTVFGVKPHGNDVTVSDCKFNNVSYAMNTEFGVNGFLAQDNQAGLLGAYFCWAYGRDHTYLGNIVQNSANEHIIRMANAKRVLIAHNDFQNTIKTTVWAMTGRWCYVAHNTLRRGPMLVGPNFAYGSPSERFSDVVIEANEILDEGVLLYSGAERIMLRNNIISAPSQAAVSIWGWHSPMSRTVRDVKIYNNTVINDSNQFGTFLRLADGAENVKVMNNLYVAPWLNTHNNAANVFSLDPDLHTHTFRNNMWAQSSTSNWVHFINSSGVVAGQWSAHSEVGTENYHDFTGSDLGGDYQPLFNARIGRPIGSVMVDYYGNPRPASGSRNVGAVE
jgi:hypothetical protein